MYVKQLRAERGTEVERKEPERREPRSMVCGEAGAGEGGWLKEVG